MRTIKFKVTGQHIECTETISDLVGNTREYVKALFTLSSEWEGLIQIAVFTANGKNYPVLIESGECEVPCKVLMQESFTVGCYAGASTDRITTDTCTVRVEESVRYQVSSDYVDMYKKMKQEAESMKENIAEYEAAVRETMTEHCNHKTYTPDGAHDLRIHDGVFQYYDGGWKNTKVQTADAQETYSWLDLALLRFIGQYDYDDTRDVLLSSFKLEEKGETVSESVLDILEGGYSKVIYARSGNRMYGWKVYKDSSAEYGVKITSLYKARGDERLTLALQLESTPFLVFENIAENGDSVEVAIICFVEHYCYFEWTPKIYTGPIGLVDPIEYKAEGNSYRKIGDMIFVQGKFELPMSIDYVECIDMGITANGVYKLRLMDINKREYALLQTTAESKVAIFEGDKTGTSCQTMYICGYFSMKK